ncbi:MAG: serine/threonine-protein kinase [Candidatus Melainabacteria bacterium]|nr:serine/threonine-protein kinase [Candidatus Melainabacteria bacterium]
MQNTTFAERYQIIDLLGKGGMGEVYLAHDIVLNIDVAVKVLPSSLAELGAARLQREAIALAKLNHPNIARVLDFSQTKDNSPYMVMEYLNGESLDQIVKKQKVLDLKSALTIFAQICRGLEFAHSMGVIHRDLKPSNIMLITSEENPLQVKILDFGIAKVTTENQRLTSTGSLVGSPLYMSPEHAEGIADLPPSDIYSLGCLMFECLTGVPPLKGANALETISFHRTQAPPLLTDVRPESSFPKDLVNLLDECLRKTPQTRPQTAKEVEERLIEIKQYLETGQNKNAGFQQIPKKTIFKISQSQVSLFAVSVLVAGMLGVGIYWVVNLPKTDEKVVKKAISEVQQEKKEIEKKYGTRSPFEEHEVYYRTKENGSIEVKLPPRTTDDNFKIVKKGNEIFLVSSDATGRGFYDLAHLQLTTISIQYGQIEDQYCDAFTKFPLLGYLKVQSPKLTDKGVEMITRHKHFKALHLYSDKITDKGVSYLSSLKNLESVTLASKSITSASMDYIVPLKQINMLFLKDIEFNDGFAEKISKLRKLKEFTLNNATIPDSNSWRFFVDTTISSLILENLNLDKTLFTHILSSTKLKTLEINNCTFTKDALEAIARNETLKNLRIFNSQTMHPENFEDLRKSKVEILNFKNCPVDDGLALRFVAIPTLKTLILNMTDAEPSIQNEIEKTFEKKYHRKLRVQVN